MVSTSTLLAFIPVFLFLSLLPGLCMTLALSLGVSLGFKRTTWFMYGELLGVFLISLMAILGVSIIILDFPFLFNVIKWGGSFYLIYVGIKMFMSSSEESMFGDQSTNESTRKGLFIKGFLSAIYNPKGWLLLMSLYPTYIDYKKNLWIQSSSLLSISLLIEGSVMCLYILSGAKLRSYIQKNKKEKYIKKISGAMIACVGLMIIIV